ncbi:hypothetical protein MGYG_04960 [Nannizzia gypsea CBS 118893]|uniref:Uncharacterized protein n=1 Tax=Arthroderma gypseum (strain ATCC MYA-4604 / CBS 118893) TaxID=535722 RepID=E4UXR4_ARTGP|nr:hypothetical protein MGYG_04960 [Nannizzia gypsea CBS 118893]EFR01959.1 hypothetical protein MGYG_04960 [Nannizzia gypsea CBS 118893]
MPVRNHLRKEGHRGQLSPLFPRHELKISGPLPHPFPAAYDAEPPVTPNLLPVTPNVVAFNSSYMSSPRQSHQCPQTPIQSTPSETSRPATYHPHPSPGAPVSHAHQESLSSNASHSSTMHRRRGSTLKTVMRKIFGRKPRDELDDLKSPQEIPEIYPQSPEVASLPDDEEDMTVQPPARFHRSSSLPSLKNSPKRSSRNSIFGLGSPPEALSSSELLDVRGHRRRATLPSVALSINDTLELASKLDAVGTFERKSSIASLDALASKADTHYKRRSRSACGLRETAKSHRMSPIQWRRRSDEIRFWRESTLNDFAEPRPDTGAVSSATSHASPEEKDADLSEESIGCPIEGDESEDSEPNGEEGFDFKNLMESMQTENEVSLAQRVATLEVKLMDLEFAIAKLQNNNTEATTAKKKATSSPVRGRPMEPINDSSQFINSFVSTPSITPPQGSPAEIEPMQRSSPITLCNHSLECISQSRRPPSPHRSDSGFKGISVEQYSALTTLMRREQCARKLLESQILSMQQEIRRLQTGEPWVPGQGSTFLRSSSPDSQVLANPYLHDSPRQVPSNPWKLPHNIESSQNDSNSINSYRHNSDSSRYNTYHRSRNDYSLPHNNHIPGMI